MNALLTELRRKIASDSCDSATFQKEQGIRGENAAKLVRDELRHSPAGVASRREQESLQEATETTGIPGESQSRICRSDLARRRNSLRAMMASAPKSTTHFYLTDDRSDPEHVVLAIGIRGIGTAELSIPREQYDPFTLAEVIAAAHGPGEAETVRDGGYALGTAETL